jgi:DNA primase
MRIDFLRELAPYMDRFQRAKITDNKMISCSPFREDSHPSFAISLTTGGFIDSGSFEQRYRSGSFIALLALLSEDSELAVQKYLEDKYDVQKVNSDDLELSPNLKMTMKIDLSGDYQQYMTKRVTPAYDYLNKRGISDVICTMFNVGYFEPKDALTLPWYSKRDDLVNCKYRSLKGKHFYYANTGELISKHLYGMNLAKTMTHRPIYITEGEIDAMSLWELGFPAVAIGGGSISRDQLFLLRVSGLSHLIVATDNDSIGNALYEKINVKYSKYVNVGRLELPEGIKDVNEGLLDSKFGLFNACCKAEEKVTKMSNISPFTK